MWHMAGSEGTFRKITLKESLEQSCYKPHVVFFFNTVLQQSKKKLKRYANIFKYFWTNV